MRVLQNLLTEYLINFLMKLSSIFIFSKKALRKTQCLLCHFYATEVVYRRRRFLRVNPASVIDFITSLFCRIPEYSGMTNFLISPPSKNAYSFLPPVSQSTPNSGAVSWRDWMSSWAIVLAPEDSQFAVMAAAIWFLLIIYVYILP